MKKRVKNLECIREINISLHTKLNVFHFISEKKPFFPENLSKIYKIYFDSYLLQDDFVKFLFLKSNVINIYKDMCPKVLQIE